jgi:short-subunit dehydrogenase
VVAEQGYRGLMEGRRRVVPGFANKLITLAPRFIPKGVLLALAARRQRSRAARSVPEA